MFFALGTEHANGDNSAYILVEMSPYIQHSNTCAEPLEEVVHPDGVLLRDVRSIKPVFLQEIWKLFLKLGRPSPHRLLERVKTFVHKSPPIFGVFSEQLSSLRRILRLHRPISCRQQLRGEGRLFFARFVDASL